MIRSTVGISAELHSSLPLSIPVSHRILGIVFINYLSFLHLLVHDCSTKLMLCIIKPILVSSLGPCVVATVVIELGVASSDVISISPLGLDPATACPPLERVM